MDEKNKGGRPPKDIDPVQQLVKMKVASFEYIEKLEAENAALKETLKSLRAIAQEILEKATQ